MSNLVKEIAKKLLIKAIDSSSKESGRFELMKQLEDIVPDVSDQYTTFDVDDIFLEKMVRGLHAFQMSLVQNACELIDNKDVNIVDIGDSSGTHQRFLRSKNIINNGKEVNALSVNLDPVAVNKIKKKGLNAIECRAENLTEHPEFSGDSVDLFLSFETLEHLFDPISFLRSISLSKGDPYFVITVPYLKKSRVGLHQIRRKEVKDIYAENTHIFELCPEDWKLLFQLSGWEVVHEEVYRMFPRYNPLVLTSFVWKKLAFDGFFGCVLRKSEKYSSTYRSW